MRIPVATYRLQITDEFTLHSAREIVPYLAHLGISDLYLSPIFEARSGSTHGYDVTDPTRIRAAVGGIDALRELAAEAQRHRMGILLDIVPNHMAASVENPWWRDVLLRGAASEYAHFFDIDWGTPAAPKRLRLPLLGAELGTLIERGEITIDAAAGEAVYHETRLPLAAGTFNDPDVRRVLDAQHYELGFWRDAVRTLNYRRFFDITDLAGLRVEDDDVFDATHSLIRTLAAEGTITGLRIDHIDGLRDPAGYLDRLRERVRGPDGGPVYTLVEKILERSENLPDGWECEGTTGYEFLSIATGTLIEPAGHRRISEFYRRITADTRSFGDLVREKKLLVMERLFPAELDGLAAALSELTDLDEDIARRVIMELSASLGVYRTYIRDRGVRAADAERIDEAVADAMQRATDLAREIALLRSLLLTPATRTLDFIMRWQQFTGPVMAKGFEDTALYCHNALLAVNDVGSDPVRPHVAAHELHATLAARLERMPHALNATATHDTKRGEDTRARIAVLSELPDEWRSGLRRWMREGEEWKAEVTEHDTAEPGADVDSLLYQTVIGAWPIEGADDAFLDRIQEYMTKAVREAKEQTSWRRPDEDFEQGLGAFIDKLMDDLGREGLADEVAAFAERVAPFGALNACAQLLLKVTAPGIPDIYQGTELWSLTLVDPDNRRPVDYAERRRVFQELEALLTAPHAAEITALLRDWRDGRIKLFLTAAALRFRARHRYVFEEGEVMPLHVRGPRAEHVVAFARVRDEHACITVLPRWSTRLTGSGTLPLDSSVWEGTALPIPDRLRRPWHNALTGETHQDAAELPVAQLFASIPFALLDTSQPIGA